MGEKYKSGLLEEVAEQVGCDYLSNLREPVLYPKIRSVIELINESDYMMREWKDAVSYITGRTGAESTPAEAKSTLLCYLNTKRRHS